jgi:hypothetical protein
MNNPKKKKTIKRRQVKEKEILLEHLKKYPIQLLACEKAGIGKATYYRWRNEDAKFAKAVEEAMAEGDEFINDMSEHQLLSLIKEKHWPAVLYRLNKCHPKYNKTKVEISTPIDVEFNHNQKY